MCLVAVLHDLAAVVKVFHAASYTVRFLPDVARFEVQFGGPAIPRAPRGDDVG